MKIVIVFGFILNLFAVAHAGCGTCEASTNYSCDDKNTARLCAGGVPTSLSFACPTDHVCVSSSPYPCIKQESSTKYDCQEKCSIDCTLPLPPGELYTHVCLGPNKYKLCTNIRSFNSTCSEGDICTADYICEPSNSNNRPVCSEDVTTTTPIVITEATTLTTQASTETEATSQATTPQKPLSADEICEGKPNRSKYPLSPPDPFCRLFVLNLIIYFFYSEFL
ncbi:hypothetical protein ACFFRR_009219 [Megaselia abdita]